MIKWTGVFPVAMLCVLVSASTQAALPMNEGEWEITTKMEMPGMPMQMPAHTITQCITKKDMVPGQDKSGQECKTISSKISGNTMSWKMECQSPQGPTSMDGKVTYTGDTMHGEIKMNQAGTHMTQRMSGRRLGKCK